jgi:hypothetical protein
MATVTVNLTPGGEPNTVVVSFTSTEGQLVRAIALDVQFSDPCAWIDDVNCVHAGYNIYPGSINIDAGGNVTNYGTCAGVLGDNAMTSEQGSLYEIGVDTPPTPGNLFIITLEGCGQVGSGGDVVITVSENVLRGGIVMEDAGAPSAVVLNGTTVNIGECQIPPPVCPGDICDSSTMGPPDGTVDSGDFYKIYGEILNQYPGFVDPTYKYDIGCPF